MKQSANEIKKVKKNKMKVKTYKIKVYEMEVKKLADNTVKAYELSLKKLKESGINIDSIRLDDLEVYFNDAEVPESTQGIIMSAILYYSKGKCNNIELQPILSSRMKKYREKKKSKDMENKLSEKERLKYISWNSVLLVYNKMRKVIMEVEDTEDAFYDYVLLSLYIYHPVRRIDDYLEMYIGDIEDIYRDNKCILWTSPESIKKNGDEYDAKKVLKYEIKGEKNYYRRSDGGSFFIFEKYKTKNDHGRQIIEVHPGLEKILKKYIDIKDLRNGEKLFNLSKSNFVIRLSNIFDKIIKKNISVTILRHSYITEKLSDVKMTEHDKFILSHKMAHSEYMQRLYRKVDHDESIDDEIEDAIEKVKLKRWIKHIEHHETEEEKKEAINRSKKKYNEKIKAMRKSKK
jgi:hypothetical protein